MDTLWAAILVLMLLSADAAVGGPSCARGEDQSPLDFSDQIIRRLENARISENPFAYCNAQMTKRYLLANGHAAAELNAMSPTNLSALALKTSRESQASGWEASLVPTRETKELAFRSVMHTPDLGPFTEPAPTVDAAVDAMKKVFDADPCGLPPSHPFLAGAYDLEHLDEIQFSDTPGFTQRILEAGGALKLCGELVSIGSLPACHRTLSKIIADMRARGNAGEFTQPALFSEVIGSGAYDRGLKIAAMKLIERYRAPTAVGADLFGDLRRSFVEGGSTPDQAETMTWRTLGLISTGGSNMTTRLSKIKFKGDRWPVVTALSAIAGILPALDHKFGARGPLYSLPTDVGGRCDTSKSYHFWMSAYLAHEATVLSKAPEAAVAAAYSANKAYHNVGNFTSRGAGAILTHEPFTPASQIMRADLTYAMNGAAFGAARAAGLGVKLNVDDGLKTLVNASRPQRALSRDEIGDGVSLSHYGRWSKTFQPNVLYDRVMTNIRFPDRIPAAAGVPKAGAPKCKGSVAQ